MRNAWIAYEDPYALPMTNLSSGSAGQNLARRYVIIITECFERAVTWTVAVQSVAVLAKHWRRNTSRCLCWSKCNRYYSRALGSYVLRREYEIAGCVHRFGVRAWHKLCLLLGRYYAHIASRGCSITLHG